MHAARGGRRASAVTWLPSALSRVLGLSGAWVFVCPRVPTREGVCHWAWARVNNTYLCNDFVARHACHAVKRIQGSLQLGLPVTLQNAATDARKHYG